MKANHWGLLLLVLGLVIGFAVGSGTADNPARAQNVPGGVVAAPMPRFQISAWASPTGPRPEFAGGVKLPSYQRGCYIIDTVSGECWHAMLDGPPKKIWQKVR